MNQSLGQPVYKVSIHLGASSLSFLLSEYLSGGSREIEFLEQPVAFARDIFRRGNVMRDTTERIVTILQGFVRTLSEYGLSLEDITIAAASNILKEAKNHGVLLHRIKIATGISFRVLDSGTMTHLMYQKIQRRRQEAPFTNKGTTLAVHMGPGNTRALLLKDGQVEGYHSYRLGSHRASEALRLSHTNGAEYLRVMRSHCSSQLNAIRYTFRAESIDQVVLIGYEIQQVAPFLGNKVPFHIGIKHYEKFLEECAGLTSEQRMKRFFLDVHSEHAFLPALQANFSLLHAFKIQRYWIPETNYERGILHDLAHSSMNDTGLEREILRDARMLAGKYKADPSHYEHVSDLAESLFQQTLTVHGLGAWELVLLKTACIVHEVGGYVSGSMHHKHSYYLIRHSEIFGLDSDSLEVVGLVARYHRQSPPKNSHKEYVSLDPSTQILVSKLSALLRVADALDVAQQQRIRQIQVSQSQNTLTLSVCARADLELERLTLEKKGNLFKALFGLDLKLNHLP